MPSLIPELKREVLDENIPVSALLRKALIVAKELNDKENEKWIAKELKGYPDREQVPTCRTIFGRPIFRDHYTGWQYVYTQNLGREMADKISSFVFSSPIAEFESNAKEDIVAITYHPESERILIKAMGGNPGIPAIQFTGAQFQEVLNVVRNRLLEWINNVPDPPAGQVAEAIPVQPRYKPARLRSYLNENKSWIFQGLGTEIFKWLGRGIIIILVFLLGYYLSRQQSNQSATPTVSPTPMITPTTKPSM